MPRVSDSFYLPTGDPGTWQPTEATIGPWSPRSQHGGPPAALVVREAERLAAGVVSGPADALRLSLDFLGPVSTDPVVVAGEVVRTGRSITLVDVTLSQGGRTALHGRVWVLRRAPQGTTPTVPAAAPSTTRTPTRYNPSTVWDFPYARHLDWRAAGGTLVGPGPAQVWGRARVPLVPGECPTSLQRAALRRRLRRRRLGRARLGPVVLRQRRPRPAPAAADAGRVGPARRPHPAGVHRHRAVRHDDPRPRRCLRHHRADAAGLAPGLTRPPSRA